MYLSSYYKNVTNSTDTELRQDVNRMFGVFLRSKAMLLETNPETDNSQHSQSLPLATSQRFTKPSQSLYSLESLFKNPPVELIFL